MPERLTPHTESAPPSLDISILQDEVSEGLFQSVESVRNPQFRSLYISALVDALARYDEKVSQKWKTINDIPQDSLTRAMNRPGAIPQGFVRPFAFPALIDRQTWGAISHMPPAQRAKYTVALRELFQRDPRAIVTRLERVTSVSDTKTPVRSDEELTRVHPAVMRNPFASATGSGGSAIKVSGVVAERAPVTSQSPAPKDEEGGRLAMFHLKDLGRSVTTQPEGARPSSRKGQAPYNPRAAKKN